MTPRLELLDAERVALRATKCLLILTAGELLKLLLSNPAAWTKAVRRGKAERRGRATEARLKNAE